jgi:hypothetical protein
MLNTKFLHPHINNDNDKYAILGCAIKLVFGSLKCVNMDKFM